MDANGTAAVHRDVDIALGPPYLQGMSDSRRGCWCSRTVPAPDGWVR